MYIVYLLAMTGEKAWQFHDYGYGSVLKDFIHNIYYTLQKKPGLNLSPGILFLTPNPMDELMELTEKICDFHNKIVEESQKG